MAKTRAKKTGARPVTARGGEVLNRRLEEAEARFQTLAQGLPLTSYVAALDVQGAFTYMSPQVEGLLGFAASDWTRNPRFWFERLHPEDRSRMIMEAVRAHAGGAGFTAEYRLIDKAGRTRWVRDESKIVRGRAGRPLFIQGTWTEITGRKELEDRSAAKDRQLSLAKTELEQLVSVASHELAAPLRRIVNLGDLLERRAPKGLDEESRGILTRMVQSAWIMQELVTGLREYAEGGISGGGASVADLGEAAARVLRQLDASVKASGAEITVGPLPAVRAEPESADALLRHLLENALKFRGKSPPRIHVSAERGGGQCVVAVRDNGIGIAPGQAKRVFGVFARLHPRGRFPGAGLGLASCKRIVERLGGRIWVDSEEGEGSTFYFSLPCAGPP